MRAYDYWFVFRNWQVGIGADVEIVAADELDRAYDRLTAGDVRYRFVLDVSTIAKG